MPRSLAAGSSPSRELRHFTNREQERHVLKRILALPPGQPLPVVIFYGVGGTGKSWLLRRLRADLPPEIPSALLDFDPQSGGAPYHTDYSRALAELRRQLAAVECPRFDLAYSWLRFHERVKDEAQFLSLSWYNGVDTRANRFDGIFPTGGPNAIEP